jgi:hypothetical protein
VDYYFAYLDYGTYGALPANTILVDSYSASSSAVQLGAFSPTGHAWESMNIPPDTTPPATPSATIAYVIGQTRINLRWDPDTDNVGVSAYNLYRDGALIGTTSGLVYYDSGLLPGTVYTYTVTATDAAGNISAISAPLVVQTTE